MMDMVLAREIVMGEGKLRKDYVDTRDGRGYVIGEGEQPYPRSKNVRFLQCK